MSTRPKYGIKTIVFDKKKRSGLPCTVAAFFPDKKNGGYKNVITDENGREFIVNEADLAKKGDAVFVVALDWRSEDEGTNKVVLVTKDFDKAKSEFDRLVAQQCEYETTNGQSMTHETDELWFSSYLDGDYALNHYDVAIAITELV